MKENIYIFIQLNSIFQPEVFVFLAKGNQLKKSGWIEKKYDEVLIENIILFMSLLIILICFFSNNYLK